MDKEINEKYLIGKLVYGEMLPLSHKLLLNDYKEWYYVVNKNRPYESFGWEYFGREMQGESLNEEALEKAVHYSATIVFIYPHRIYTIEAKKFKEYVDSNNTRRPAYSGEVIVSIPLSIMRSFKRKHE